MTKVASERNAKRPRKELSRREFLKVGGAAVGLGAVGLMVGSQGCTPKTAAVGGSAVKYGMVIDLDRCFGCGSCVATCKVENNTPKGSFWMHVFRWEEGDYPNVKVAFLPRPCMHCDDPPCVKVCPVGARYKREDGLVLTNFNTCIGCRYCEVACPYSVNQFNWKRPEENQYYDWEKDEGANVYGTGSVQAYIGDAIPPYQNPDLKGLYGKEQRLVAGGGHYVGVIEKCTFCVHLLEKGGRPACVDNCPVEALYFGDLNNPESQVSRLVAEKHSFRLLEELGTRPRVYYVGGTPPAEAARLLTIESRKVEWGRVR